MMLECLDHDGGCEGPVEFRHPLSATGRSFARCDKHWEKRLAEQERITATYPDSSSPPSWFDPAYAGESWDDE